MNCKPGDVAIRVRATNPSLMPIGSVVECLHLYPGVSDVLTSDGRVVQLDSVWHVDWRRQRRGPRGGELGVPDADLQPLRDPGDDAVDEMLRPLPEEVAA